MTAFQAAINQLQAAREPQAPEAAVKAATKARGALAKKVAKKGSIAASICAGLKAGKSPQKVLALVLKKHPEAATTIACVYWYSSRIKRGLIVL